MRGDGDGRWDVCLPPGDGDPFLAATLWLVEREHAALVATTSSIPAGSIHARTLLEVVPLVDPAAPGPYGRLEGLGIVLVEPSPRTLALLDRSAFAAGCALMLLPSPFGSKPRAWQDAWCWAQRHRPPQVAALWERSALDPAGVLTDEEVWALALRAGAGAAEVVLRDGMADESASRNVWLRSVAGRRA